jgi:hypothetical protein
MSQQPMAELLQLDKQSMRGVCISFNADNIPFLVLELNFLIQHEHPVDLQTGNEDELLVSVCGQVLEAFVEEIGADRIAPDRGIRDWFGFSLDSFQAVQEFAYLLNRSAQALHVARPALFCGLDKMFEQSFSPFYQ